MKIINVMGVGVIGYATAEVLLKLGHQVRVFNIQPARQAELELLGFRPMQDDEGDFTFVCVPEQAVREALANAPLSSLWVVQSTMAADDLVIL